MSDGEKAVAYLKRTLVELDKTRRQLQEAERRFTEPIAIVGMGCRYPGGVRCPEDLWNLVSEGREGISGLPDDRGWELESIPGPNADDPKADFRGGFLDDFANFDNEFFGIGSDEALIMDPQQRLLLETTWEAFESAKVRPTSLKGRRVGSFIGLSVQTYGSWLLGAVSEGSSVYYASGNSGSMASGRLAHILGLEGPAVTVDTACSSSAVALHLACQSLRIGECEMAITGGATVISTPWMYVEYSRQPLFPISQKGQCKSFAADADGTVFSEGVGVLVLERLSDALRLGHDVLGVVRGSAINQDGASNGLTAPNGVAHERVIRQALVSAGVSPAEVDAVEAHGMGTLLGDPIEAQALLAAYGRDREENRPLWLGSLKSNIGNTQAASAMAGIIKMVMSMKHGQLPKTLHVEHPSQNVDWNSGAVSLLAEPMPWLKADRARLAAVHSFGWSGTNAHIILEEHICADVYTNDSDNVNSMTPVAIYSKADGKTSDLPITWPVSGRGDDGLRRQARRLGEFVRDNPEISLVDIGYSLALSRDRLSHRCVVIGTDRDDMREALERISDDTPPSTVVIGRPSSGRDDVVFLFAGVQWQGAIDLVDSSPAFNSEIAKIEAILGSSVDWSLQGALRGDAGVSAQPEVGIIVDFAIQVAILAVWQACGVTPSAVVGHDSSEIVAAYAAGCMTLHDAVNAVVSRSRGELLDTKLATTGIPLWSSTTGDVYSGSTINSRTWSSNGVDGPSNMANIAQALLEHGYRAFVEVTPSTIVPESLKKTAIVVSGAGAHGRGLEGMFVSLAELWVSGVEVDWASVMRHDDVREIPLPTYAFAQHRHWLDKSPLWGADSIMMEQGDTLRDSLTIASQLDKVN